MVGPLVLAMAVVVGAEDAAGDYQVVGFVQEVGIVIDPPGAEIRVRVIDADAHVPVAVGTTLDARVDIIEYEAFWQHAAGKAYHMVLFRSHAHDPWQVGQPGDEVQIDDLPAAETIDPEHQRHEALERVLAEAGLRSPPAEPQTVPVPPVPGDYRPGAGERQALLDELALITEELEALDATVATAQDRRQRAALVAELDVITTALDALRPDGPVFDAALQTMVDEATAAIGDDPGAQVLVDDLRGLAAVDGLSVDTALPSLKRLGRRAERRAARPSATEHVAELVEPAPMAPPAHAVSPPSVRSATVRVLDVGHTWLVMYEGRMRPGPAVSEDGRSLVVEAADGRFAVVRADFPVAVDQRLVVIQVVEDHRP